MTELNSIGELGEIEGPLHVAIGVFDGVHRGHQAVIEAALSSARSAGGPGTAVVVTFDPHPARVLAPASAPRLLTSTTHKLQLLGEMGIEQVVVVPFDHDFAETPAAEFVAHLHRSSRDKLTKICVGADWKFGRGCSGNVDLLRRLGAGMGFAVTGVPTVEISGMVASSTRIREAVAGGDFAVANRLLGRPYTVLGTVIQGRGMGRRLGFPTANLTVHSEQLPPTGVYAVGVQLRAENTAIERPGVGNLGYRPSIEGEPSKRLLEVHLLDWEGDLYGQDVEVRFLEFLRPERRFPELETLQQQIADDADLARRIAKENGL